jgi:TonB family protein
VKQFVQANQSKDVDANLAFYAPNVDYFDDHQKDQAYIRADIGTYNERWPVRHDSIEGDIHVQEKAADERYAASFRLNYYAESAARAQWSKGQFAIDLDISIVDGAPRISGIKEKILRHQKGNLKTGAPTNAAPSRSQSGVETSHQESNLSSRLVFAPQPTYPSEARQKRLIGSGRFRISFDAEGKAISVTIVRSTGRSLLDTNTISTLKRWRAIAGTPSTIVVPITYAKP